MTLRKRRPGLTYPTSEDWHYVGDATTGLGTTFMTDWANYGANQNLAFRKREAGILELQGFVENTRAPLVPRAKEFFLLPLAWRPSVDTHVGTVTIQTDDFAADGYVVSPLIINTPGYVLVDNLDADPVLGGPYVGVAQYVWIHVRSFLTPADAP